MRSNASPMRSVKNLIQFSLMLVMIIGYYTYGKLVEKIDA